MTSYEETTHSFIVKIWREDNAYRPWRGYIIHVLTGEQRYLQDLAEIPRFIEPYLARMGIAQSFWQRILWRVGRRHIG